ncbi:type I-E CRISPR-associated protein Cse2/CasB [Halomonas campisalis]|uniref:Type I-E CRISPR-associated protein Cse2/CasB n=1 Tax=Billgrantia campisalis TaxID=74661 RepID=A0ABS9PB34_9GAMM|nr:type I-E CRISPR-associated protein Cse2/CasB [Halomonas campisalis]MCG6658856.1 type I-E CRISPR-associated protein Cse2/CasB [Halomonas campisalis]MDR5864495.1 type I-E CRISPR-associated protein Cse2/CasB [Halomonas campisalis]
MSETAEPQAEKETPVVTEYLRAVRPEEAFAVRCWWQRLTLPAEELKAFTSAPPWPKGVRAMLRRSETPEAAMLSEAFRHLWHSVEKVEGSWMGQRDIRLQAWACIALVLAEVTAERPNVSLGSQLGKQKKDTGKPHMSELRFQQLLTCQTPEELVQRLRRALALIDKRDVSVVHLADNIALWWRESQGDMAPQPSGRLGFLWANDYFEALSRYQRGSD